MALFHKALKRKQTIFYICLLFIAYVIVASRDKSNGVTTIYIDDYQQHILDLRRDFENGTQHVARLADAFDAPGSDVDGRINVVLTSCGDTPGAQDYQPEKIRRLVEVETLLKSAIFNNPNDLHFYIIATPFDRFYISEFLNNIRNTTAFDFLFTFYDKAEHVNIIAENSDGTKSWQKIVGEEPSYPCGTQWVHMPWMIKHVSRVIYLDTNSVVLGPLKPMWDLFSRFNTKQYFAMAPWANSSATNPNSQLKTADNHGFDPSIMLMNLDRIRHIGKWRLEIKHAADSLRDTIAEGSSTAIMNTFLDTHKDIVYKLPCSYNYRKEFCDTAVMNVIGNKSSYDRMSASPYTANDIGTKPQHECAHAQTNGVLILHGDRILTEADDYFVTRDYFLRQVFELYRGIKLGVHTHKHVIDTLKELLLFNYKTKCSSNIDMFYKRLNVNETIPVPTRKVTIL